jgi:hypothetical protein
VPTKLKVYRTAIGFHDAYVAAPSQKAALEAWGSEHNLFARGVAELVTDPALTKVPLARPGEVVKRLRGSAAEQIAALPADALSQKHRREAKTEERARASRAKKVAPRPDRSDLDRAEKALADAEARHRAEEQRLVEKEAQLALERRELDRAHQIELDRLRRAAEKAERDYRRAMAKWQG